MFVIEYLKNSVELINKVILDTSTVNAVENAAQMIVEAYKSGRKVLLMGNGGSAADAQHMAGELISKMFMERKPLPAVALTTDTSVITAIGNDYGFEKVFSKQVEANGVSGDVLIAFSTSGKSKNIIEALKIAQIKGIKTIGFSGSNISEMDELCDLMIKVPSDSTPKVQELHITFVHIICTIVEKALFT